jgi:hypothetical protein
MAIVLSVSLNLTASSVLHGADLSAVSASARIHSFNQEARLCAGIMYKLIASWDSGKGQIQMSFNAWVTFPF